MTLRRLLPIVWLALAGTAFAADEHTHAHGAKSLHGGLVAESGHLEFELVTASGQATLYLREHGKPVDAAGAKGTLTVLSGSNKSSATLVPGAAGTLVATGAFAAVPGTKYVASVGVPGRKMANVRFARP